MRSWGRAAVLVAGFCLTHTGLVSADTPPAPADLLRARPAAWTDPLRNCPDLRQADPGAGNVAVVMFHVGSTGVPSQASIRISSNSAPLDSDALACVMKLKFLPATAAGDGGAMASWQQIAWRYARETPVAASPATTATPAAPAASSAPAAVAGAAAAGAAVAGASAPGAGVAASNHSVAVRSASTEVRVCADASGKLTQDPAISRSSGDAAFDAAALEVARSGSGHYRAGITASGQSAPGCMVLSIRSAGP
jgi:TonB family protein